jgi:hypothetical protein
MHRAKPSRIIANDMYLSTLRSHIEAMGGELDIIDSFLDATVEFSNFTELGSTVGDAKWGLAHIKHRRNVAAKPT